MGNDDDAKVLVLMVVRDDAVVCPHFGVFHDSKLWLVTAWLIDPNTQVATPERMIRVDEYRESDHPHFDYEDVRLPKALIEGLTQDAPGYEVRSLPGAPRVHRRHLKMLPSIFQ